jgi:hypothetical protein
MKSETESTSKYVSIRDPRLVIVRVKTEIKRKGGMIWRTKKRTRKVKEGRKNNRWRKR